MQASEQQQIIAHLPTLETAVARFGEVHDRILGVLQDLERHLSSQLSAWDAPSAEAYGRAHRKWTKSAAHATETVGWLRNVVAVAHGNYTAARAANLAMFPRDGT